MYMVFVNLLYINMKKATKALLFSKSRQPSWHIRAILYINENIMY